jgi:hypothetical protein
MLLDLRVVLAAILATVLLLIAGFSLIAGVRSPLKPPPAQSRPQQVRNRAPDDTAPTGDKATPVLPSTPESSRGKTANVVPHEQSTLTDDDKGVVPPATAVHTNQKVKAKKKVRTAIKNAPAKPSSTFTFGQ